MAMQKQLSRIFRKKRFRACLPNTFVSLRKQFSQSPEDINFPCQQQNFRKLTLYADNRRR